MARRDNQGIQIAMIVFILTTLLFMVGTYLGYSSWATAKGELDAKTKQLSDSDSQMRRVSQATDGMKQAIGLDPSLADDAAETEASRLAKEVFGAGLPDESRNFIGIVRARDTRIADLASQLKKANDEIKELNATVKLKDENANKMIAQARAAEKAANDELNERRKTWQDGLDEKDNKLNQIASERDAAEAEKNTKVAEARKLVAVAQGSEAELQGRAKSLQEQLNEIKQDTPDKYDGKVLGVVAATKTVLLNVGRADGIQPKTTFGVYDADETNVRTAKKKASIEITRVLSDNRSEARITDIDYTQPIVANDYIYSPIWSPGSRIGIALVGDMDVDQDGRDDREYIKNLIKLNGGQVDAENVDGKVVGGMTVNTRYIVVGEGSSDRGSALVQQEMLADADRLTIEKMSVDELMDLMSPPGRARSVRYGTGNPRLSDFAPTPNESRRRFVPKSQASFRNRIPTLKRFGQ